MEDIININDKEDMALVCVAIWNGVPMMYEWLSKDEADKRLLKVLGKDEENIKNAIQND